MPKKGKITAPKGITKNSRPGKRASSTKGKVTPKVTPKVTQTARKKANKVIKLSIAKASKVKVISNFKFLHFLEKLAQLKAGASVLVSKLIPALLNENRLVLFGELPEPIVRNSISEPYNAGSVQGPVLYGVGTGHPAPPNIKNPRPGFPEGLNFSTYVDTVISNLATTGALPAGLPIPSDIPIPRCWGTGIPVTFGQGMTKDDWHWDRKGGGTCHEMEHAIKCILQAMLNFLSQSKTEDDKTMHVLLKTFFISILGEDEDNSKKAQKFAGKITKLLRKQQVIAGLPSCALFNQFKCTIDLIKVELKQIPDQGWFYVEVSPNMDLLDIKIEGKSVNVFTLLAKKMKGGKSQSGKWENGKYNPKGGCNFYGMEAQDETNKKDGTVRHRSAWGADAGAPLSPSSGSGSRLDQCYKTEGGGFASGVPDSPSVYQMINDDPIYAKELQYAYSLKDMTDEQLANLMIERTRIVCAEYNKISQIPHIGWMLSGITLAASLMMLSISMGRVLESNDDLKTSNDPQLYKLGSKATGFLTRLATTMAPINLAPGGKSYMDFFLSDPSIDAYQADFLTKVSNPVTSSYLEVPLFGQGGGSLEIFDAPTSPTSTSPNAGNHKVRIPDQRFALDDGFAGEDTGLALDEGFAGEDTGLDLGEGFAGEYSDEDSDEDLDEEGGYDYDEEYDPEDATYGDEGLDDEHEMIFNEYLDLYSEGFGDVAEVSEESEEDMGQSIVSKLSQEYIALLANMEPSKAAEEFQENHKLFYEVLSSLSRRYDGLEDVFLRIIDGNDADDLIYIDNIFKDLEVILNARVSEAPIEGVEPEDEMVDDSRSLAPPIGVEMVAVSGLLAPPIEGARSKKKTKKKHKSRKNKKSIKKKTKRKSKRKNKRKTAKKKKKKKQSDLIDKIIDRLGY